MRKGNDKDINSGDVVYGSDRKRVGSIEYCEEEYCKIDTGSPDVDCYIPSTAIESIAPGEVILTVPAGQIGRIGGDRPPKKTAAGARREVVTHRESERFQRSPEEEIGESEPM